MHRRRPLGPWLGLCVLALNLASCAGPAAGDPTVRDAGAPPEVRVALNVCTSSATGIQILLATARDRRIFQKYGLDVTLTSLEGGASVAAALISGGAQLCVSSGVAVVNAVVAGADLAVIGNVLRTAGYALMVRDSIRSAADLKGKAIAVSSPGSASETAARLALETLGADRRGDVTILSVGGQSERMAALEAGYVVGTILGPPETILLKRKGFHALVEVKNLRDVHSAIVTSKAFLAGRRGAALNFMKAVAETMFLLKSDKDVAMAVFGKSLGLDPRTDAAVLAEIYEVLLKGTLLDVPYPVVADLETMLADAAKKHPGALRLRAEQVADPSIVRELEDTGFFRDLRGRK